MGAIGKLAVQALVPVTFLVATWIMVAFGGGEIATREALRGSARVAFVLFLLAFVARPLDDLMPSGFSAWLMETRKTIGVSFALAMGIHLGLIVWLFVLSAPDIPDAVTMADFLIGAPVLLLVFIMGATSAGALRRAMGPQPWNRLHIVGLYLVWLVFMLCLTDSMGRKSPPYPASDYAPFIVLLVLAMGLRLFVRFRRKPTSSGLSHS